MNKKETLHIYVRTSTDGQDVKRQIELGKKFSNEMGMNFKVWNDEGKSGLKSFEDTREQLVELLFEVDVGIIEHIWVEDYSRLTRLIDDQMKIDTLILDNNLNIYEGLSGNQIYQPNNTMKRMYQIMKTMMGSDVKRDEIKKSIDRKIQKFRDGFYVRGNISFGFDKEDGYLVENEEETKWVKKIFELYSQGKTLRDIQKELKVNNIKTKRGNDWSWRGIEVVLDNREYTGITHYTDMTKDPHRKNPKKYPYTDESRWIVYTNDNLPKIISDELFQKCQNRLNRNKSRVSKYNYFLRDKIKCSCGNDWVGRVMSRKSRGKENEYNYMCHNSFRRYFRKVEERKHLHKEGICNKPKRIPTDKLDDMVWNNLLETLENSSFIKERVKRDLLGGKYDTSSSRKRVNKEQKRIRKEIKSLEKSRVNLLKEKFLYELSEVDFNEIDSSISQKMSELKSDLQKVLNREILLDKRSEWIDWIGQHHKDVEEYRKVTDVKQRRKILDIYVDKVEISYDHEIQQHNIILHYRYPLVNDEIEYTRDKNSRVKWDKWGKSYRIKKGDQVVSLSDLKNNSSGVTNVHSTVTDLARLRGISTSQPFKTAI
jgi:hypothetical protein